METNKTTPTTLTEKVAAFKLKARESLRMALISPRLGKISTLENTIEEVKNQKATFEKREIAVAKYNLTKLDAEHPLFDEMKEAAEKRIVALEERLPTFDKEVEELEKEIAEQKEGIAKIESGETKVSKEALADLVEEMIKQDALNSVK